MFSVCPIRTYSICGIQYLMSNKTQSYNDVKSYWNSREYKTVKPIWYSAVVLHYYCNFTLHIRQYDTACSLLLSFNFSQFRIWMKMFHTFKSRVWHWERDWLWQIETSKDLWHETLKNQSVLRETALLPTP